MEDLTRQEVLKIIESDQEKRKASIKYVYRGNCLEVDPDGACFHLESNWCYPSLEEALVYIDEEGDQTLKAQYEMYKRWSETEIPDWASTCTKEFAIKVASLAKEYLDGKLKWRMKQVDFWPESDEECYGEG